MSSTMALLHRDGDGIIVSQSRGKKKAWVSVRCTDIARAEQICRKWAAQGRNVYVKHALHDGATRLSKTGRMIPDCHEHRFAGSRTFLIDVDAGDKKYYATQQDAYLAFRHAIGQLKAMGVPFPNLVNQTGGGFHAGWVLDDVIDAATWNKLTGILYSLLRGHSLQLDDAVKSIERGVRMCGPGFLNINHGSPVATKVLVAKAAYRAGDFTKAVLKHGLRPVIDQSYSGSNFVPANAADLNNEEFGAPRSHSLDLDVVVAHCKVIEHAAATGGAEDDYQQWIDVLGVVAKTDNEDTGRLFAQVVSDQHPDYDEDYFLAKYESIRADGKGYTLCKTFQTRPNSHTGQTKMGLCTTCRWYRQVNSPGGIQGALNTEQPRRQSTGTFSSDRILDTIYYQNSAGLWRDKAKDDEDDPLIWTGTKLTDMRLLQVDTDHREQVLAFTRSDPKGNNEQDIHIDLNRMSTYLALMNQLSHYGVSIQHHQQKAVFNAMITFMEHLRSLRQVGTKYTRLGWTENREAFVLGNKVYHGNGNAEIILANSDMENFNPRGERTTYDNIVGRIMQGERRAAAHAFIASSLGSTLLDLCGLTGISINFFSPQSGHGKTTISRLSASLWGNPKAMAFTLDDTDNSMHHRAGILNNLPTMFDELRMGTDTAQKVGRMAFRVASGQEKSRMTKDAKLQEQRAWRAFTIFSTNHAFADLAANKVIGGDAALARVLDFPVPPLPSNAATNAGQIALDVAKLDHCNGHIGHEFIQHVVKNREVYAELMGKTFNKLILRTSNNSGDVSGRNHAAAGAAMIIAAQIAAKKALIPIDPKLVVRAVCDALDAAHVQKRMVQAATVPMALLGDYLRVTEDRRIITQAAGGKTMAIVNQNWRKPIAAEINFKTGNVIIDVQPLIIWLHSETHVASTVLDGLKQFRTTGYLGQGTPEQSAMKRDVLVIPSTTPEFTDLFKEKAQ